MDPLTLALIGGTLLAGGTGLQMVGQRKAERAQEDAYRDYARRQRKLSQEGQQLFDKGAAGQEMGAQEQVAREAGAERAAESNRLAEATTSYSDLPAASSGATVIEGLKSKTLGDALREARGRVKARGLLEGFGDRSFNRALELGQLGREFDFLGEQGRGNAMVRDVALQTAPMRGAGMRTLGDILATTGMITGAYGLSGIGAPAEAYGSLGKFGKPLVDPRTGLVIGGI